MEGRALGPLGCHRGSLGGEKKEGKKEDFVEGGRGRELGRSTERQRVRKEGEL